MDLHLYAILKKQFKQLNPTGRWNNVRTYNRGDIVVYGDNTWYAKKNNITNEAPSESTTSSWTIFLTGGGGGSGGGGTFATELEAIAGTAKNKYMSPYLVSKAIAHKGTVARSVNRIEDLDDLTMFEEGALYAISSELSRSEAGFYSVMYGSSEKDRGIQVFVGAFGTIYIRHFVPKDEGFRFFSWSKVQARSQNTFNSFTGNPVVYFSRVRTDPGEGLKLLMFNERSIEGSLYHLVTGRANNVHHVVSVTERVFEYRGEVYGSQQVEFRPSDGSRGAVIGVRYSGGDGEYKDDFLVIYDELAEKEESQVYMSTQPVSKNAKPEDFPIGVSINHFYGFKDTEYDFATLFGVYQVTKNGSNHIIRTEVIENDSGKKIAKQYITVYVNTSEGSHNTRPLQAEGFRTSDGYNEWTAVEYVLTQKDVLDTTTSTDKHRPASANSLRLVNDLAKKALDMAESGGGGGSGGGSSSKEVNVIEKKLASESMSTYPDGISVFYTNLSDGGYPNTHGTVVTFKDGTVTAFQLFSKNGNGVFNQDVLYRVGHHTEGWGRWKTFLTPDDISTSTSSSSSTTVASSSAVKQAMDRANSAFQLGDDVKGRVVDALHYVDNSISVSTSSTWSTIIAEIMNIDVSGGGSERIDNKYNLSINNNFMVGLANGAKFMTFEGGGSGYNIRTSIYLDSPRFSVITPTGQVNNCVGVIPIYNNSDKVVSSLYVAKEMSGVRFVFSDTSMSILRGVNVYQWN